MSISQAEYNNVLFRQTADMVEKHRLDKERERVDRKKKREAQQKEREKYFAKNRAAIEEKRRAKNESIKLKNELRKTHVLIPSFLTAPQPPKMGKRKGRKAGPWERNKNRRGGDRKSLEGELQDRYKPMPIDPIEPVSGIEVGGVTLRNRTPKSSSKTGAYSNNSIWIRCRVPGCRYKCVNPSAIEVHMSSIHGDVKESDLIELDAVGRKPSDWENYGKPFYACEYPSCSYDYYRFKSVQRHAMNVHNLPRTTHPQLSPVFKVPGRPQHLPVQFQPVQPGSPPTRAKIGGAVCDVEDIEWPTPPPALVSQTSRDIMSLEKDLFPKREIFGSIFGPIPLQTQVSLSPSPNFPSQYLFEGVSPPPPPTKIHNEVIELSDAIQSPITSIHVVKHKIFFVGEMCLPTYEERENEQEDDSEETGKSVLKELCGLRKMSDEMIEMVIDKKEEELKKMLRLERVEFRKAESPKVESHSSMRKKGSISRKCCGVHARSPHENWCKKFDGRGVSERSSKPKQDAIAKYHQRYMELGLPEEGMLSKEQFMGKYNSYRRSEAEIEKMTSELSTMEEER